MKTSSSRSLFDNIKNIRNPGITEFSALLQMLPDPAVLVDGVKRNIFIGNATFYKTFLLTKTEVQNQALASIFEDQEDRQLKDKQESLRAIHRPHRISIPVSVKEHALDMGQSWYLLTFAKLSELPEKNETYSDSIYSLFIEILEVDQTTDFLEWKKLLVNALSSHFSYDNFSIYFTSIEKPELSLVASNDSKVPLPAALPPSDLFRLQDPTVWTPGKRVLTELHRSARIQGYSFLASAPLKNGVEGIGLFVFGDSEKQPLKETQSFVKLIAKIISNRIQNQDRDTTYERKLKEHTKRLEVLETEFENNPEGICIIDQTYKLISLNPAAEWMLGYANWEVVNQPIENVLIGPKNLSPGLEAASKGIATPNIQETSLHHRDGHSFPVQLQITPVVKNEIVSSILVCFKDISEHEEIVARTQQLEHRALLGDVTSVFAHEVRNPVNNISTGLQLLSSRLDKDDPNQEVLTRIQGDCTRLNDLMESVLAFSRPVDQRFEIVDLHSMLQKIIERWRPRMSKVNVNPFFECELENPQISGNIRSLERVFINLISNSIEAMSSTGGALAVKIIKHQQIADKPQLEVAISDNGPGIPDEIQKRLFEPFVTNKPQGTGLGLAITKKIVTAHHGSINVDSFPGGTIFHVVLPIFDGEKG